MNRLTKSVLRLAYQAVPFKRQMFERVRHRVQLPETLYRHLHFRGPFRVPIAESNGFWTHSDGAYVENGLFWAGLRGWEATSLQTWASLCRGQSGLLLDIGANTGSYSLLAGSVAPAARIVAFEPVPYNLTLLRRNLALNDFPVEVEAAAVTARSGPVTLHDASPGALNYSASIEGQGEGAVTYEVAGVSLDAWLESAGDQSIGAVKIDVEGHEAAVLAGFRNAMAKHSCPILIEVLDAVAAEACEAQLQGLGYARFNILEGKGLVPAERLRAPQGQNWNWLLCTEADVEARGIRPLMA